MAENQEVNQTKDSKIPAENQEVNWTKDFKIPVYLILIGGLVGILVGYSWEYFKFKRETLFEKRIDLILENRKQASEIFIDFDNLRRQIKSNEQHLRVTSKSGCNPSIYESDVEALKTIGLRVIHLATITKGVIPSDSLDIQVKEFKSQLKGYVQCIENNSTCDICSDKFPNIAVPLENIVALHTKEIKLKIQLEDE